MCEVRPPSAARFAFAAASPHRHATAAAQSTARVRMAAALAPPPPRARARGLLSIFFQGVLAAGGSESHVSLSMFRLCPVTALENDRMPKMSHFLSDSRLSLTVVSGEEMTKSEFLQTLPPFPQ